MKCSLTHFPTNLDKKLLYKRFSIEDCEESTHNLIPISKKAFLVGQEWDNLVIQPLKSDFIISVLRALFIKPSSTHLHEILKLGW